MGVNDAREQLEVAKAEVARLEQQVEELEAEVPPCDGGCSYLTGPEETCSRHGRPVAEVWDMVNRVAAERDSLARLHEVATERTVQLAAVIERAREHLGGSFIASDGYRSYATADSAAIRDLFDAADTGAALREVRAQAWEEGFATGLHEDDDYPNPYRQAEGESR